jgi:glutathione S-transferase
LPPLPYRELSPFEQIPAIDDDGIIVSESGAILFYLARKTGKLMPATPAGEAQVMRWCFAALNSVEIPVLMLWCIDVGAGSEPPPSLRKWTAAWVHQRLAALEDWLEDRQFIATDTFTIADILMSHVLTQLKDEALLAPYPRVRGYQARCFARPAWRRAFERYDARVEAA